MIRPTRTPDSPPRARTTLSSTRAADGRRTRQAPRSTAWMSWADGIASGWRAIAREVVGAVPGGAGLVAKGAIAYAGTIALGKALQRLYETGIPANRATVLRFYKEAYAGARDIVRDRLRAIRGRAQLKELPPPPEESGAESVPEGEER